MLQRKMKGTFIITRNLSLKKTQYIFQFWRVNYSDDGNFTKESKKLCKFEKVFDIQLNYWGIKNLQLTVIHENPTVNRTKSQVAFGLGAAESEYMFGQLLWTMWHSCLSGLRITCSLQNSDSLAAWRSQKHVI